MNVLVLATHHGAFLTIQQLKERKIKNVIVVIPQSQIEKYKNFEGKEFTQYEQNLKRICGKKIQLYVSDEWNPNLKMEYAVNILSDLGCKGTWLVLEAGSLLGGVLEEPKLSATFGVVKHRVHPKFKKLYKMLGKPEESKMIYAGNFFVNVENKRGNVVELDSTTFHRPDILYAKSFGMLWCIRYQQMVSESTAMCFWMEVIRGTQEIGEWVAYPYDKYKALALKTKKYLPKITFQNIINNGEKTEWLSELVSLDL